MNPTSPQRRNRKSRNKKRLLLRMTCQCLTNYVKVAFHMLMPLNPMSPSLIIVMMMIMHLLMILIEIISSVRYSIFLCCT